MRAARAGPASLKPEMAGIPLAARCPACLTVFRVVPDQLRVSQGWVRCGRCTEVFNASLALVDVETGAPRKAADVLSPRELGIEVVAAHEDPEWATGAGIEAGEPVQAPAASEPPLADSLDAERTAEPVAADSPGLPIEPGADAPQHLDGEPAAAPPPVEASHAVTPDATPEPTGSATAPSFVRQADRAARWRQPRVRVALAALGVVGVAGLAGQVLFEYRDLAAARFPGLRPALLAACSTLGCRIEAARAINSLAVESSGLVRIERSSIYRLQVALRNRAGIEVALPALDLSFTDSQGRLIARKVLQPAEVGATGTTLGAGREAALQATLQARAGEAIAGYTIELFYP